MKNLNLQSYLNSLKNLPLTELLAVLNDETSTQYRLVRILTSASIIVHNYITYYKSMNQDMELKLSSVLTIVHMKFVDKKRVITLRDLDRLIKSELNIISNMMFQGITNYQIPDSICHSGLDNLIMKEVRNDVIRKTPNRLKLAVYHYLTTGEIVIDNYNDLDKYLFYTIIESAGHSVDSKLNLTHKLESIGDKSMFLYIMSKRYPDLFILLSSVKSINALVLLSETSANLGYSTDKLIEVFDEVSSLAIKFTDKSKVSESDKLLFAEIAKEVNFDESFTTITSLLSKSVDKLYDDFESSLSSAAFRAKSSGNLTSFNTVLNSEILSQVSILNKLQSLVTSVPG